MTQKEFNRIKEWCYGEGKYSFVMDNIVKTKDLLTFLKEMVGE